MNSSQTKPPTVGEINEACSLGLFVYYGNRLGVLGAVAHRDHEVTIKGRIWIKRAIDQAWEYVDASSVMITTEKVKTRKDGSMRGKRQGGQTPHLRSVKKGEKGESAGEAAPEKRKPQAIVSRTGPAKQGDLPGVEVSKRKIQEIEDLADTWETTKKAKEDAHTAFLDADENLVVSMRKHNRTSYSRTTWGKVTVPQPKIHAKFKREKEKKASKK